MNDQTEWREAEECSHINATYGSSSWPLWWSSVCEEKRYSKSLSMSCKVTVNDDFSWTRKSGTDVEVLINHWPRFLTILMLQVLRNFV